MPKQSKTDSLTNNDLDKIANLLDNRIAPLATKEFVREEIEGLRNYVHEGFETVMGGIEDLAEQMAEKEKVERLAKWAKEVGEKVGVKIDI